MSGPPAQTLSPSWRRYEDGYCQNCDRKWNENNSEIWKNWDFVVKAIRSRDVSWLRDLFEITIRGGAVSIWGGDTAMRSWHNKQAKNCINSKHKSSRARSRAQLHAANDLLLSSLPLACSHRHHLFLLVQSVSRHLFLVNCDPLFILHHSISEVRIMPLLYFNLGKV